MGPSSEGVGAAEAPEMADASTAEKRNFILTGGSRECVLEDVGALFLRKRERFL
jgi:hypothetical protein